MLPHYRTCIIPLGLLSMQLDRDGIEEMHVDLGMKPNLATPTNLKLQL